MLFSHLLLRLPRGLFTFTRRPSAGVIRVWPAHHSSLITLRITRNTPVMPFEVHKRPERLNSWNRVIESRSGHECVSTAFSVHCLAKGRLVKSLRLLLLPNLHRCFVLGIILDVQDNITHYEPHTSLGPFLTSPLPVPNTFAQCYALRHPQHIPYSIAQLHN